MGVAKEQSIERRHKRADRTRSANGDREWRGFVVCELSALDKQRIRELQGEYAQAWAWLVDAVFNGYKFGASYDHNTSAFTTTLTCWRASDRNNGMCLTAKGGSIEAALLSLWYKDTVLLEGRWAVGGTGATTFSDPMDVG